MRRIGLSRFPLLVYMIEARSLRTLASNIVFVTDCETWFPLNFAAPSSLFLLHFSCLLSRSLLLHHITQATHQSISSSYRMAPLCGLPLPTSPRTRSRESGEWNGNSTNDDHKSMRSKRPVSPSLIVSGGARIPLCRNSFR